MSKKLQVKDFRLLRKLVYEYDARTFFGSQSLTCFIISLRYLEKLCYAHFQASLNRLIRLQESGFLSFQLLRAAGFGKKISEISIRIERKGLDIIHNRNRLQQKIKEYNLQREEEYEEFEL